MTDSNQHSSADVDLRHMSDLCRAAMIDDGRRGARLAADDRFAEYATPERVFGLIEQLETLRRAIGHLWDSAIDNNETWLADWCSTVLNETPSNPAKRPLTDVELARGYVDPDRAPFKFIVPLEDA